MNKHPILALLQKACKGLLFVSETEAELEPFVWDDGDALTPEHLSNLAGAEDKPKFDALTKLLSEQLSGIKVYKLGAVNLKVFIVGKTKDGLWAGVKTEVVET